MGRRFWGRVTRFRRGGTAYAVGSRKKNKYGAEKVVYDGHRFDSKREAYRYRALQLRCLAGEITEPERQPSFELHTVNAAGERVRIGKFTADFRYRELATGVVVIEDAKSAPTKKNTAYRLRKRIVEAEYGIQIVEV